ncbi:MAG: AAA family ATPase [Methyloceanibacter sp.]|uniref:AAA family ATPase n=1 Tax=Methyloceanibacter sp. TaxID=1965321 RepID=UPI003D9AD981
MVKIIDPHRIINALGDLADKPRWVAWRGEIIQRKDGTETPTKIPYDPHNGHRARVPTDPSTWGSRRQAQGRWKKLNGNGQVGGVGIVLGDLDANHVLMGIDLDSCITKKGFVRSWANEVIDRFNTYTEISPSGGGVKLFFLLAAKDKDAIDALLGFNADGKPKTRKSFSAGKHREIAIDRARFYAVTDNGLDDTPETLRRVPVDDVRWLVEEAGPRFLIRYQTTDNEASTTRTRDNSGSGHGFRFMRDRKKRGDTYEAARDALLLDQGPAGEWARRKDERDIRRAWDNATNGTNERPLTTRAVADFETMPLDWFWEPFIPLAMTTAMFGDGGIGKSTIVLDIIARLTANKRMPLCKGEALSGSALILTKEDDMNRVVRPRLEAAGADLTKVHVPGYDVPDDPKEFDTHVDLNKCIAELEKQIIKHGDVRIIVLDPASDFCGKVDPNEEKPVRDFLTPLTSLARRYDIALVIIIHVNKDQMQAAHHRGLGSVAWRNVPRSAVLVADDPDTGGRKLMVQTKTNLTEFGLCALGFTMRTVKVGESGYGVVEWEDQLCDADPEKLMAKRQPKSKLEQAKEFLQDLLKDGSMPRDDIKYAAEGEGISWASIRRAKDALRIQSFKRKGESEYRWRLPKPRGT